MTTTLRLMNEPFVFSSDNLSACVGLSVTIGDLSPDVVLRSSGWVVGRAEVLFRT